MTVYHAIQIHHVLLRNQRVLGAPAGKIGFSASIAEPSRPFQAARLLGTSTHRPSARHHLPSARRVRSSARPPRARLAFGRPPAVPRATDFRRTVAVAMRAADHLDAAIARREGATTRDARDDAAARPSTTSGRSRRRVRGRAATGDARNGSTTARSFWGFSASRWLAASARETTSDGARERRARRGRVQRRSRRQSTRAPPLASSRRSSPRRESGSSDFPSTGASTAPHAQIARDPDPALLSSLRSPSL